MGTRMSAERKELEDMRRLNERVRDKARKKARRNKAQVNSVEYKRFSK